MKMSFRKRGEIKTYLDYGKKIFNCDQNTLSKRMDKGNSLNRGNFLFLKKEILNKNMDKAYMVRLSSKCLNCV